MKPERDVNNKIAGAVVKTGFGVALACCAMPFAMADYPVAGVNPSQRPMGAPVISWVQHDKSWYQHALTGVDKPYPRSLWFLDNQGGWYTPFNRPGMPGVYDMRGWHKK